MISVIIPHKSTPDNDRALGIALQSIHDCAAHESHEVIIDDRPICPYKIWNDRAPTAKHDLLVFSNSDVIFGPRWDEKFIEYTKERDYVSGYLVECGAIGVASQNIERDFGKKPKLFDRAAFNQFCLTEASKRPPQVNERGWLMPCCLRKESFLEAGMFDTDQGEFPVPLDLKFWDKITARGDWRIYRVNSWAYHFQNLSGKPR